MEVTALYKYARISPKKVFDLAREIQGRPAGEAGEILRVIPRKGARLLRKTLMSAIANAENNHEVNGEGMIVHRALIEEGPALRRFWAGARGSAKPIRRRTSHIRIILSDQNR